jgi:hypothetical protein
MHIEVRRILQVRNYILCASAGDWINVRIKISKWLDKQQLTLESGLDCWCFMMRKEKKSRGTCWLSYLSNLNGKNYLLQLYQWQQCQLESSPTIEHTTAKTHYYPSCVLAITALFILWAEDDRELALQGMADVVCRN